MKAGLRYYGRARAITTGSLKALRFKLGLTQFALAEEADVNLRQVQKAEQGKNIERVDAAAIAEAVGKPYETLFTEVGGEVPEDHQTGPPTEAVRNAGLHPEKQDARWMRFLATLSWQTPYCITECAWVYRFPGIGVDSIRLVYQPDQRSSRYDVSMPESAREAVMSWHHQNPARETAIRDESWGLQVRLEKAEFDHSSGRHVFTLAPMKFLYYVGLQQRLWSDPGLRDLRDNTFDNAVGGLPAGATLILPSQFAIHMGVITQSGFVLLRQRRQDTELYPSAWEAGIGEFMHGPKYKGVFPHFVRGKPNLARFLKNAVAEELGYHGAQPKDFAIYGFAIEHQTLAPKLLVLYTSDADIGALCEGGKKRTGKKGLSGKRIATDWSPDVRSIKLNPQEIATALKRFPAWGPTSRLTLMLALRQDTHSPEEHLALVEEVNALRLRDFAIANETAG